MSEETAVTAYGLFASDKSTILLTWTALDLNQIVELWSFANMFGIALYQIKRIVIIT